jgi:hypothetical protein
MYRRMGLADTGFIVNHRVETNFTDGAFAEAFARAAVRLYADDDWFRTTQRLLCEKVPLLYEDPTTIHEWERFIVAAAATTRV